jgi:hypothetical protein
MRKLSFILTTTVLLIAAACNGEFIEPGMLDQPGRNGSFGGGGGGGGGSGAYTVAFDINGGIGTVPASKRGNLGSNIVLPGEKGFSRSGYTFLGWGLSSSSTTASYKAGDSYKILINITLYAIWEIPSTISDQANPIPLKVDVWTLGNITSSSTNGEAWYSFNVTNGTTYYLWWNDGFYGDYTKTLNINVSAYLNDSATPISGLNGTTNAFATAKSFTAASDGTVKLNVKPNATNGTGTFAIAYTTNNSRPYVPATVNFNINGGSGTAPSPITVNYGSNATLPGSSGFSKTNYTLSGWNTNSSGTGTFYSVGASYPTSNSAVTLYAVWIHTGPTTPLTANSWTDGSITSSSTNGEIWYSFDVTNGTTYYLWWNDGYSSGGDGTKTLDIYVDAYYSNNTTAIFTRVDSAWSSSRSLTANSTGTVKLRVYPASSGRTGTFAIAYNTVNTKPPFPCTVTFNFRGGSGNVSSMTALSGTSITLPGTTGFSKSGYTLVAWSNTNNANYGDSYLIGSPYTVTASITLYAVWTSNLTGSGTEASPYQLTLNKWADSFISSTASDAANWYSFSVIEGNTYYVWCNDGNDSSGSLQSATLDTRISAYYNDNTPIFQNEDGGYSTAQSFTASSSGTVKLKVIPYPNGKIGTFSVAYNTSNRRP